MRYTTIYPATNQKGPSGWPGQTPGIRVAARQEASAAVVTDLNKLWQDTLPRISGKSKLAEAIRYALHRRKAFEQFLQDGRIEADADAWACRRRLVISDLDALMPWNFKK